MSDKRDTLVRLLITETKLSVDRILDIADELFPKTDATGGRSPSFIKELIKRLASHGWITDRIPDSTRNIQIWRSGFRAGQPNRGYGWYSPICKVYRWLGYEFDDEMYDPEWGRLVGTDIDDVIAWRELPRRG